MMRSLVPFVLSTVILSACTGGSSASLPPTDAIPIVATTTVFADLVRQVGGDRVTVRSIVPAGGEAHAFDPTPSDAQALENARLVVMNGLGLDDWFVGLAEDAGAADVPLLALGESLDEVEYISDEGGGPNPHLWLDLSYAEVYVDRIRLKLIEIDPQGQQEYDANSDSYMDQLAELDTATVQTFEKFAPDARKVVSFHDAFPYFAQAYGLDIIGVVVESPGQDPSAADVAALIEAIDSSGASAILAESQFSDEVAQTIAAETDAVVVADLFTDSLGDPPLDTFLAAFEHDVEAIAQALRE